MCEPDGEVCAGCGHGAEHHQHADACRFEDCVCKRYDGAPLAFEGEMDPYGVEEMDGPRARRPEGHTSRDGNNSASIGNMGKE